MNVKKLFADENATETINPTTPRREKLARSSPFDDATRLAANLSTQTRYENDIASVNDFETEERRRRTNRQTQNKKSDLEQQAKRKISKSPTESDLIEPKKQTKQPQNERSVPIYSSQIQDANTIDDIFKIFDKYVIPTEFALGLQRLCQLALDDENNDLVQRYAQLETNRQRFESLLLGFVCRIVRFSLEIESEILRF